VPPIIDSATVIAWLGGEKAANLVHEKNWFCTSGKAVCMQMQMTAIAGRCRE
jgi:hypothetical protein